MKVVISEFMDDSALAAFGAEVEILNDAGLVQNRGALLAAVADADALIVRNRTQVDAELLDAAPKLRVVGRLGVGLDNIDMASCAARSIVVHPATGANTLSVAEYVISASLSLLRGASAATGAMLRGEWPRSALIGREAAGRCMGLIGFGAIARAVAERARALGMNIAAFDPYLPGDDPAWAEVRRCSAAELLPIADVVSLHVPLTDETRGLIDSRAIAAMKPGAILINTARGGIVREAALAEALRAGHLGGAALDVFETEPLTEEAAARFRDAPNLILTPHIAGVTQEGNLRVSHLTVENVKRSLADA